MESHVKALFYRTFTLQDRLWTSPGVLRKKGNEALWPQNPMVIVESWATRNVENALMTIKSMNAVKQSLNQSVEFGVALHAVSDRVDGIHDRRMVHIE